MLVLIALGAMNLVAMLVLVGVILLEKYWTRGSYRNYAEVSAEVFVMVGEKTHGTWNGVPAAGLSDVLPRSCVKRFAELDHFGPDEKAPDLVGRALTDFFGRGA